MGQKGLGRGPRRRIPGHVVPNVALPGRAFPISRLPLQSVRVLFARPSRPRPASHNLRVLLRRNALLRAVSRDAEAESDVRSLRRNRGSVSALVVSWWMHPRCCAVAAAEAGTAERRVLSTINHTLGRLGRRPPPLRTPRLLRPLALPAATALHRVPHRARRLALLLLRPRGTLCGYSFGY